MPHESLILHRPFLQRSGIFGKLLAHKHIALVAWHSIWSKAFYQNVMPSADGSDRFFPGSGSSWWRGLGGGYVFPYPAIFGTKSTHKNRGVPKAMFFWPTLSQLRAAGVTISVLCLSTGNFDGLGDIRKREPQHKQVFCVRGLVKFHGESWAFSCLFIYFLCKWPNTKNNECKEMEKSCMQIGFLACKEKTFEFGCFSGFILFCKKRGVTGDDLQILDDPKLQDRWVQLPSSWLPDSPIFFAWGWLAKMAIQPCGSQGGFFVGRMGVKGLYYAKILCWRLWDSWWKAKPLHCSLLMSEVFQARDARCETLGTTLLSY